MEYDSILFYRFFFASLALGTVMLLKRESFRIALKDLPVFVLLSVFYKCCRLWCRT